MSGDVERNPVPTTKELGDQVASILDIVQGMESGQADVLGEIKTLRDDLSRTNSAVSGLSVRLSAVETNTSTHVSSLRELQAEMTSSGLPLTRMTDHVFALERRCDDAKNRLRRNYLLFYSHPDTENETWANSELVLKLCSEKLSANLSLSCVERAYRAGRFNRKKMRPVIVKF